MLPAIVKVVFELRLVADNKFISITIIITWFPAVLFVVHNK